MHEPNSLSSQRLIHAPSEGRMGGGADYGGAYPGQLAEFQRR
jgi:hypothetical protein